ncbi:MAG: site-specific DNA-methyltransferase, partial [Nanopusillaceae archaeon]
NERVFDFDENKKELDIYFEYRSLTEEEKERYKEGNTVSQDKINEETIKILQEKIPENSLAGLIFKQEGEKTLIQKHLYKYTRRNTTDYFIHRDLKGFLERELDFYIKNEFLQLDDLQVLERSGYFDRLKLYLIGVRAFRNIALKIIEFLAQIENFQKKLWEKKKFVIDTHYVITLDKIKEYAGEEFLQSILDEILSNEKQKEEWKELFEIEVKDK